MKARYQPMSDRTNWAQKINTAWRKSVDAIFEVGDLLINAKEELAHGEFSKMVEDDLLFDIRSAQMLMAIARDERLQNAKHASHLPASWATLYTISKLTDEELNDAIADGVINAKAERSQIEAIVARRTSPKTEQAQVIPLKACSLPAAVETVALNIIQSSPVASEEVVVPLRRTSLGSEDDDGAKTLIDLVVHMTPRTMQRVSDLLAGPQSADREEFAAKIGELHAAC